MSIQDILRKVLEYPIALAATALALILGIAFLVRGLALPEIEQSITELQATRQTLTMNRKNAVGLESDLEMITTMVSEIDKRSLRSNQRSSNIAYFYATEAESSIKLSSITQGTAVVPNKKEKLFTALKSRTVIPFKLSANGLFEDVLEYMGALQEGDKLGRIRSFSISTQREDAGSALVKLDLNINMLGEEVKK